MARFFTLTKSKSNDYVSFRRRRSVEGKKGAGPVSLKFITIVIITLLSLLYLAQANRSATKGYAIKELEEEKIELEEDIEALEVEASRQRSLKEIEAKTQDLGMVEVDKVEYE